MVFGAEFFVAAGRAVFEEEPGVRVD